MGFGTAFANAFMEVDARIEQGKRDRFSLAYDRITRQKEAYEKAEAEDRRLIKQAKFLVGEVQGIPKDAWMDAYEALVNGMSADAVIAKLSSTSYRPIQPPRQPDQARAQGQQNQFQAPQNQTIPQQAPQQPMNGPRMQSGQSPDMFQQQQQQAPQPASNRFNQPLPQQEPQPVQQPQQQPQPDLIQQGMDFFNPANMQQRQVQAAQGQVGTELGLTPQQIQQYETGYQPPELNRTYEAIPAQAVNDPMTVLGFKPGTPISRGDYIGMIAKASGYASMDFIPEEGLKYIEAVKTLGPLIDKMTAPTTDPATASSLWGMAKSLSDDMAPTLDKKVQVKSAIDSLMQLDEIATKYPEVLTATGGFVSFVNSMGTELQAAMSTAERILKTNPNASEEDFVKELGTTVDLGAISNLGEAHKAFFAVATRTVYALAKAAGQTGNGLSNRDIERWNAALINSPGIDAFKENIMTIANEYISEIDNEIAQFGQRLDFKMASQDETLKSYIGEDVLMPFSEELANDPKYSNWLMGQAEGDKPTDTDAALSETPDLGIDKLSSEIPTTGNVTEERPKGTEITITDDVLSRMPPNVAAELEKYRGRTGILTDDGRFWIGD